MFQCLKKNRRVPFPTGPLFGYYDCHPVYGGRRLIISCHLKKTDCPRRLIKLTVLEIGNHAGQ